MYYYLVVSEDKRSERLELEDNDRRFEEDENSGGQEGVVRMDGGDEQDGVAGIRGDYMIEEEVEEEVFEDDVGDVEEVDYEEEHHDMVNERRKRKEFEVFVGGLDRDATEEDLRKVFSQVGEITEVRLLKNPVTQKNKGFAFLRFATIEQARRAIHELKHPVVSFLFHFSLLFIILEVLSNINFLNVSRKLILQLFFKTCTIC